MKTLTRPWFKHPPGTRVTSDPAATGAGIVRVAKVREEWLEREGYFAPVKAPPATHPPAASAATAIPAELPAPRARPIAPKEATDGE